MTDADRRNDQLIADLARSEDSGSGDVAPSVRELKQELDSLADRLTAPAGSAPFENEAGLLKVQNRIRNLGRLAVTAAQSDESLPRELGQYLLLETIGRGGMGTVYRARHTRLGRDVAVKVLAADRVQDAEAVRRFDREIKAVGQLEHRHIVRAMDAGEADGTRYLVMELVDGVDIGTLASRNEALPIAEACELVRQAAVGLQEAHEHGMVHRDVKPSNLMLAVDPRGKAEATVRVLDMGLALLEDRQSVANRLTGKDQVMGTVDYMAPEQSQDTHNVDIRADIYSLAATLYRLLTGRVVFPREDYSSLMQKLTALEKETPTPASELRSDIPAGLDALLLRCLAKHPDARPATPADLAAELQQFATGADLSRLTKTEPTTGSDMSTPEPNSPETSASKATIPPVTNASPGQRETMLPGQSESVAEPVAVTNSSPGQEFGRYRLEECLGQGAMGAVYKALDTQLDRKVAIKIPKFDTTDSALLERFYREARSAATLSHANICPVFDVGEIDGTHYISMGFIEGKPLSAFIKPEKPLTEKQVVSIVRKLAVALNEAHDKGIVHRDLKPDNVMIAAKATPIIMDFGLAQRETGTNEIRVTQGGQMLGTPAYMSPEQVDGNIELMGPRSDIYSLGVIVYEMLTGQLPYEGSVASVLAQIMKGEPQPPIAHRPDVNPELQAICQKMMASNPDDRYASMAEVARDLTAFVKGKATSVRDTIAGVASPGLSDQDEGLSGLIAPEEIVITPADQQPSKPPRARSSAQKLPTWAIASGIGVAAIVVLFAVYTLFIKVGDQKVQLTIDDPDAKVFVDGDEVRIENLGATIHLKPGEYGVLVKRGDIEVDSRKLTVLDGDNPVFELLVLGKTGDTATASVTPYDAPIPDDPLPEPDSASVKEAVEWLLPYSSHVSISTGGSMRHVRQASDIPDSDFKIEDIIIARDKQWPGNLSEWKHLQALRSVATFSVRDPRFNDEILAYLSGAPRLRQLQLENVSVTASGLRVLQTMPVLKELTLGNYISQRSTVVNDDAMKSVASLSGLSKLKLQFCSVTDAGLQSLASMSNLRELNITKSPITNAGVAAFRSKCPECKVTTPGLAPASVAPTPTSPRDIVQELPARDKPKGVAEGVTVFPGAPGNGRRGAWCLNVPLLPGEFANGTEWQFTFRTGGTARGLHVIHPWRNGQLVVFLYRDRLAVSPVGDKRDNYLLQSTHAVSKPSAWNDTFPLNEGAPYSVKSRLTADGSYTLEMNGKVVATSTIDTVTPFKLNEKFSDAKAIHEWSPGMAGLMVGPRDARGVNSVSDVKLSGLRQGATTTANVTVPRQPQGVRDKRTPIPPEYSNSPDPVRRAVGWAISHQYTVHYRTAKGNGSTSIFPPLADKDEYTVYRVHANQVAGIPQSDWGQLVGFGKDLNHVTIKHPDFDDAALAHLAKLPNLKILSLEACAVTDSGFNQLVEFPSLENLQIGTLSAKEDIPVSEAMLSHLVSIPKLHTLILDNCRVSDESLKLLVKSNSLQSLTMRNCGLTDASLDHLRDLSIQVLHLQGNLLTDAAGVPISEIRTLQNLTLKRTDVGNGALQRISTLPQLHTLDLAETKVTSAGFADVSNYGQLHTLLLDKTSVDDSTLKSLVNVDTLRALHLRDTHCTEEEVAAFKKARSRCYVVFSRAADAPVAAASTGDAIPPFRITADDNIPDAYAKAFDAEKRVTAWLLSRDVGIRVFDRSSPGRVSVKEINELSDIPNGDFEVMLVEVRPGHRVKPNEWGFLRELPKLQILDVADDDFDDDVLVLLKGHTGLSQLKITNTTVTDDGFRLLTTMPQMQGITITNLSDARNLPRYTDAAIDHIVQIPQLGQLSITGSDITDKGLETLIEKCPNMHHVAFEDMKISDESALQLKRLRKLRFLDLEGTQVTDEIASVIADLPELTHVDLTRTHVTNAVLPAIGNLKKLNNLQLEETKITDAGLASLTKLKGLHSLLVSGTGLTDASLPTIGRIGGLKHLHLHQTKVSQSAAQQFQDARPDMYVFRDGVKKKESN